MLMEDVVRSDILQRLDNIRVLYDKTLKELKDYDNKKYRSYILPVEPKKKAVPTKLSIIVSYVQNQSELTIPALVQHLLKDREYNHKVQNNEVSIREYLRVLVRDQVLVCINGVLKTGNIKYKGPNGEQIAEFVLKCLETKPMTSADMLLEARLQKTKITANRLRGVVSSMYLKKQIKRLPQTKMNAGWLYSI